MHNILKETHKDSNIMNLRTKDFYFKKAVLLNNVKNKLIVIPTFLVVFSYFSIFLMNIIPENINFNFARVFETDVYEITVGVVTIFIVVIVSFLDRMIDRYKEIANVFREDYDNKIFGLKDNLFSYDYSIIEKLKKNGEFISPDYNNWKYEYWYDETFSDDMNRNILCMQMDNVLYSYNVFLLCKREYIKQFIMIFCVLLFLIISFAVRTGWLMCFLVFFAMFELLKEKWEDIKTSKEIIDMNKRLLDIVQKPENVENILSDLPYHIQCIETCIIENRKKGLFLPAKIRRVYIDYYKDLDKIKSWYMDDDTVSFPSNRDDIEILSLDESKTYTIGQLQERLQIILEDITKLFDQNDIPYSLDRSTLLGAIRKNISGIEVEKQKGSLNVFDYVDLKQGGFLFWDDMINIVISKAYEDLAKELIEKHYITKYVIQDTETEEMLSIPRDSFRIRELNSRSFVDEKECISKYYKQKGIFIVVNVLSPTISNVHIDKVLKKILFNRLISKMEKCRKSFCLSKVINNKTKENRCHVKYKSLNVKMKKRKDWYLSHAKNTDILSCIPGNVSSNVKYSIGEKIRVFINAICYGNIFKMLTNKRRKSIAIKKSESYLNNAAVFGSKMKAVFEGYEYSIPTDYIDYLEQIYGKDWVVSPFSSRVDLEKYFGKSWFSYANKFHVTSLKHIRHMDIYI